MIALVRMVFLPMEIRKKRLANGMANDGTRIDIGIYVGPFFV